PSPASWLTYLRNAWGFLAVTQRAEEAENEIVEQSRLLQMHGMPGLRNHCQPRPRPRIDHLMAGRAGFFVARSNHHQAGYAQYRQPIPEGHLSTGPVAPQAVGESDRPLAQPLCAHPCPLVGRERLLAGEERLPLPAVDEGGQAVPLERIR